MLVRGHEIDVDILDELEPFELQKAKVTGDELQACSPFRDERKPSFYVNIETGLYKDFGAESEHLQQGNFIGLLSFLMNVSYEEVEDYLLEKYNVFITEVEGMELNINIQMDKKEELKTFTKEELKPYLFRMKDYLIKRGIPEDVQKEFIVGYDKEQKAIALFWRDAFTGKVVTVKFRSITGKKFYYIRGGQPVRNHVFGLYQAIQKKAEKVYIVESEIDCMYLWANGIPAVALGGSYLSDVQKRLLMRSGISAFVIATDNDKAGVRIKESIIHELAGVLQLYKITLPNYAKDINDVQKDDIKKVINSEEPITLLMNLQLNT